MRNLKKYKLIYADPPWKYKSVGITCWGGHNAAAEKQYDVMELDEICNLPVGKLANDDGAALFLWATQPLLHEAFHVVEAWGFEYKSMIIWHKIEGPPPLGYWYPVAAEYLIVATRGNIKSFKSRRINIIKHKRLGHSKKPPIFRKICEETGLEPRIELFARERLEGWDALGNELPVTIQKRLFR